MMASYVKETDEERRAASNRTFARVAASLTPEVASRYGYDAPAARPEAELEAAVRAKVAALSAALQEVRGASL
jgi:hypothetical protein